MKWLSSVLCFIFWAMSCPFAYALETNLLPQRASAPATVYFVSDIHSDLSAQAAVARSVKNLVAQNPHIGFVGLEGFQGHLDVDALRRLSDQSAVAAATTFLFKKHLLSGPALAAYISRQPLPPMYGLEGAAAYRDHFAVYREAQQHRPIVDEKLAKARHMLADDQHLNPELAKIFNAFTDYHNNKISLSDHVAFLASHRLPLTKQVQVYLAARAKEKSLSIDAARKEAAEFARNPQRDLRSFPHLQNYSDYVRLSGQINPMQLFTDISALEAAALKQFTKTSEEATWLKEARFVNLAEKLAAFSLVPAEWTEYQQAKDVAARFNLVDLSYFGAFYEQAERRNETLARSMLKTFEATKTRSAILVAGGFHSPGVRKILEQQGVTVVAVQPEVSMKSTGIGSSYLKSVRARPSQLDQILTGTIWTLAPPAAQGSAFAPLLTAVVARASHLGPIDPMLKQAVLAATPDARSLNVERTGPHSASAHLDTSTGRGIAHVDLDPRSDQPRIQSGNITLHQGPNGIQRMLIFLTFLLNACEAPNYTKTVLPEQMEAEEWATGVDVPGEVNNSWPQLNLPNLPALIEEAMQHNVDLQILDSIAFSQAVLAGARAELMPTLNYNVDGSKSAALKGDKTVSNVYGAGVTVTWEADILGRLRARRDAAGHEAVAAFEGLQWGKQVLVAQVARNYIALVYAQQQLKVAQDQEAVLKEIVAKTEAKQRIQVANPGDLQSSRSDLADAQQQVEALTFAKEKLARGLEALLGRYPKAEIDTGIDDIPPFPAVPVGLPSDIIKNRPDLREARAKIEATNSRLSAAYLDRFPIFNMTASVGSVAEKISNLPDAVGWTLGAGFFGTLWDFGRLKAAQDALEANQFTAVQVWIRRVQAAFEEVENALSAAKHLENQIAFQTTAVAERAAATEVFLLNYEAGRGTLFTALDSQRRTLDAKARLILLKQAQAENWIQLQLVLGVPFQAPKKSSGGSWSTRFEWIQKAWIETLISFTFSGAMFLILPLSMMTNTIAWASAPALFWGLHVFGNREGLTDPLVLKLTAAKSMVSVVGFLLIQQQVSGNFLLPVMGILIAAVTYWHKTIQDKVVVDFGQPGLKAKLAPLVAAGLRTASPNNLVKQSELQSRFMEHQLGRSADLLQGAARVVVIDSAFDGNLEATVRMTFSSRSEGEHVLFLTNNAEMEARIKAISSSAQVAVLPFAFQSVDNQPVGLVLASVDEYLREQSGFSLLKKLNVVARGSLPLVTDGLAPDSVFRRAVFLFLTKALTLVPFSFNNLNDMTAAAKIAAQQA